MAREPAYIVGTAAILVGLMIAMGIYELHRSRQDLIHLMEEETALLVQSLALSGENAIHAVDWVEDLIAERLLDSAWLVDRLDRTGQLSSRELAQIAEENRLYRINVFDEAGNRILSSHPRMHADSRGHSPMREIASVLTGGQEEQIIGLRECRVGTGERFAVAVHRTRGGAIVLNVDAEDIQAFRKDTGVGRLIQKIGEEEGIGYIVLQDEKGLMLASKGVKRMPKIAGDPFLREALLGSGVASRLTIIEGQKVFEVVQRFALDGVPRGLLRVGLSTEHLDEIS